jgi:hypothetical protein
MGLAPSACFAQGVTGTITGIVKDPSDAPVPDATVVVKNTATGAEFRTTSGLDGYYKVANLVAGEYVVEAQAKGFAKTTTSALRLSVLENLRVDVPLKLGQLTEVVTVEATAITVNTEDAQLGKVLRDPAGLPVLSGADGRNPLSLAATQPGVVFAGQQVGGGGPLFSVSGQRTQANNYMLDGGDSNDLAINVPDAVNVVSPNALQEFRIITGAMKAEYGRATGSVVQVITRSGGNEFHGGASEIFRNTKMNAVPFFQKSTPGGTPKTFDNGAPRKPQWNSNDFDVNFGGPIVHDKSFFFLSYLGFRRRQGDVRSATVFSDQDRALIEAHGTPEAKAVMALVPRATSGNTLFSSPANARTRDQGLAKYDHYFSQANRFSATYFIDYRSLDSEPFAFGGGNVPGFGINNRVKFQNVVLRDTHAFSPNLFNEFRASYHRSGSSGLVPQNRTSLSSLGLGKIIPDDPDAEGPPFFPIVGLDPFGNSFQGPQGRADNTFQYVDNVSWTRGRHYLKFGGEFRTYAQNTFFDLFNNGLMYIDGTGTDEGIVPQIPGLSSPVNDFAQGFVTQFIQNSAARTGYRTRSLSLFWQDDWKVRSNFTLNLGLRWEYNTGLKELRDRVAAVRVGHKSTLFPDAPTGMVFPGDQGITRSTYDEDLNNFAPRVGFAWDLLKNGKLSVRGGYGLFYDIAITEFALQFMTTPPYAIQPNIVATEYANPFEASLKNPMENPFPFKPVQRGGAFDFTEVAPLYLSVMDPHFSTPYAQQWSLGVQYQAFKEWLVDVSYVGSNGVKLFNRRQMNPAIPGPGANFRDTETRRILNQNHPEAKQFGGAPFGGITNQLTDANSNYNSLQMSVTKRFSGGLQMTHAYTWAHTIDNKSGIRGTGSRIDNARLDRGNSEQDVRHRYVFTYIYDFPWMKNQEGAVGRILGGWGVSGVTTFQTGLVFDITEPTDRCLCDSGGQRPDYIGGKIQFFDPRSTSAVSGRPNSWFDGTGGESNPFFRRVGSAASYDAGAGRFGSFGRNVLHGPGINNWDFAVFKRFKVRESHNLQFRAELFNLFNHAQFKNPDSNIASPNFGRVTETRDPRILQFALRYTF